MNTNYKAIIKNCGLRSISLMVAIFLLFSLFAGAEAAEDISRIGGEDRYKTSALVAGDVYDSADTVIIPRGDQAGQFADGLASSVLSGALDVPVLLTKPDSLPGSIKKAINKLGATRAIVLGGTEAISGSVVSGLEKLGLTVNRIGGKDRHETAAKIAEEADKKGYIASYAFIVNGFRPADSLVAAPAAFRDQAIILQTTRDSIPEVTKRALKNLGISRAYIVGGTDVVSRSVENELSGLVTLKSRLEGANRYATSVALAKEMFSSEGDIVLSGGHNENLVDSIGTCIFGQPVLFVKQNEIPTVVDNYLDKIIIDTIKIIGGTDAVSRAVSREAQYIVDEGTPAGGGGTSKTKVSAISADDVPVVGMTIKAKDLKPSGASVDYQWQRAVLGEGDEYGDFTDIDGATDATYTLKKDSENGDVGALIRLKVELPRFAGHR